MYPYMNYPAYQGMPYPYQGQQNPVQYGAQPMMNGYQSQMQNMYMPQFMHRLNEIQGMYGAPQHMPAMASAQQPMQPLFAQIMGLIGPDAQARLNGFIAKAQAQSGGNPMMMPGMVQAEVMRILGTEEGRKWINDVVDSFMVLATKKEAADLKPAA